MILDTATLESLAQPICRVHGVELVDARHLREPGGSVVRVLIERPAADGKPTTPETGAGVTLEDCTRVSWDLSVALDVHDDVIAGAYRLEVSSPGLERPLIKLADFARFEGREAKVHAQQPVDGRRNFHGTLRGVDGDSVVVELLDPHGTVVRIAHADITKAHLVYRF